MVENGDPGSLSLLRLVKPPMKAFILGVTGPPGTGKSTLVDRLTGAYRKRGLRVGVVAVDPSSPVSGGALLGDRIRMSSHAKDPGVYIRSMASRGWSGGLSRATTQAVELMDAAGFDIVFVETVGIGQADVEVIGISHASLVLLMPGLGDDVQVSKAGLMELGDVFVVNKSDLEGADALMVSLLSLVRGIKHRPPPPVVKVSAISGEGLDSLVGALEPIRQKFNEGDRTLRLRSAKGMIAEAAKGEVMERLGRVSQRTAEALAERVILGTMTLEQASSELGRSLTSRTGGHTKGRKARHR